MVTIRRATDGDVAGIVELNASGNGGNVAEEIRCALRFGVIAAEDFAVAVVGGQVVSTVGLLALQLGVGGVDVPAGQPEFVVTHESYRGRGLVRALLEMVQGWSAGRGDLVQIIAGIPYFYRQFGYAYGLRRPREWLVPPETQLVCDGDWKIRPAVASDIPALCALQDAAQSGADVRLPFSKGLWPVLLALPHAPVLVASCDGRVEAVSRLRTAAGAAMHLQALAAASTAAARSLIAAVRAEHPGRSLVVAERDSLPLAGLLGAAIPVPRRKWLYVRIGDAVTLLRRLAPVLDGRLSSSAFALESGHFEMSLYRSSLRIDYERGRLTSVAPIKSERSAGSELDVSIPPELLAGLLFGPGGVIDVEADPDVELGDNRDLMAVLLPPLRSDVLIW